jgi:transcriptional regulator with XRE-family HTH domain
MTPGKRKSTQRGHNIVGPRIRAARVKCRPPLSQSDLAARLGVLGVDLDRPTITRIENGARYLRDYEIAAFARALKVTVASLFD